MPYRVAIFSCYWANFKRCKWPNIEKINKLASHLVTLKYTNSNFFQMMTIRNTVRYIGSFVKLFNYANANANAVAP